MLQVDIEKIVPVTEARDKFNQLIDAVEGTNELYVFTKNGKPSAVLVGVNHLEKLTGESHDEVMKKVDTAQSSVGLNPEASTPAYTEPVAEPKIEPEETSLPPTEEPTPVPTEEPANEPTTAPNYEPTTPSFDTPTAPAPDEPTTDEPVSPVIPPADEAEFSSSNEPTPPPANQPASDPFATPAPPTEETPPAQPVPPANNTWNQPQQ